MKRALLGTLSMWTVGAVALRVAVVSGEACPALNADGALAAVHASEAWIERAQQPDGSYIYEYDREANTESPEYNVVRHAGVTMALYQLAASGDPRGMATADRALDWEIRHQVAHADWAALADPIDGSTELGSTALMLDGLAERRLATNDPQHDDLMRRLGRFILLLQRADGGFAAVWRADTGAPDFAQVSHYYTGEALWGLTLLQRIFPGEGWDTAARRTADYVSTVRDQLEHQKYPPWADQWSAYALAEMADWPLSDANVAYARSLAERFGFLMRVESLRRDNGLSKLLHGRQARAAGMGTWVEGLDSLWRLAGKEPRLADIRTKVGERAICGAGMLASRQVSAAKASAWPRPEVSEGAWFTEGKTRMDDQQHALSGLLNAAPIMASRDRKGRP